MIGNLDYSE